MTSAGTAVALEVEKIITRYVTLFAVTVLTDCIWNALPSVDANCSESPAAGTELNVETSTRPDWLTSTVPDVTIKVGVAPITFATLIPSAGSFVTPGPAGTCVYHASIAAGTVPGGVITDVILADNGLSRAVMPAGSTITITGTYT